MLIFQYCREWRLVNQRHTVSPGLYCGYGVEAVAKSTNTDHSIQQDILRAQIILKFRFVLVE